ncbi:MAG TPA: glycoside hydrolase family 3 N-terminal domain-containing protein, partial [Rhabdochlamydiaceae bacterium]|nr:glycoside hydrolase family 3 N-terminal domain-containing protein [Rhabdochlamydiaceae bacterium]
MFAIALLVGSPEEIVQRMSLEEKVGQLFVVPACPERGDDHLHDLRVLIEKYHIGGIILKQGTQESYRDLYEKLKAPELLHCGDAEWGVSMRMRDGVKYPRNLTLGAIQDLSLLEEFGRQVGRECRQVGLHLNFAPVADVNTNPKNPIIGTRSFGEEPSEVAKRSIIVIQAMQEEGVAATVKHYPGHGATSKDSHVELPVIKEMELLPFQEAITHQV